MPSKKTAIVAATLAGLSGLATAAVIDVRSTPAADSTAAAVVPHVRTEVVTQTIHRVRRVRVHRRKPAPATPAAAAAPAAPATVVRQAVPTAAAPAVPAPRPEPISTRSSGAGGGRADDERGEREDDHGQQEIEGEDD